MKVVTCDVCGKSNKEIVVHEDVILAYDDNELIQDVCESCLTITLKSLGHFEAPSVKEIVITPETITTRKKKDGNKV